MDGKRMQASALLQSLARCALQFFAASFAVGACLGFRQLRDDGLPERDSQLGKTGDTVCSTGAFGKRSPNLNAGQWRTWFAGCGSVARLGPNLGKNRVFGASLFGTQQQMRLVGTTASVEYLQGSTVAQAHGPRHMQGIVWI
jgi:hypothetical protein